MLGVGWGGYGCGWRLGVVYDMFCMFIAIVCSSFAFASFHVCAYGMMKRLLST